MYSYQDLLFSASLAVYVAVSVVVAAVRWGHKCEPYARHMDYYYPGWKVVVFCFLSNVLLLPAVFLPQEADAILQLRLMFVLMSPFFSAVLLFSYFGKVLKITWWRRPVLFLAVPFSLITGTALVLTLVPGSQLSGAFVKGFFSAAGLLAALCLCCFFMALRMIARALRRFSEANYSNPEDFPRQYARSVLWIPILHVAVSWTATLIGTPLSLSVGAVLLSVLSIVFLIGVLSPHRAQDVERLETGEAPVKKEEEALPAPDAVPIHSKEEILSQERKDDILRAIRIQVEEKQAYLDSHLTLASLSRACGYNRTYVSQVMSEHLGGFFVYVNRCRLAHAARLKVEQPQISVGDLIASSGFGSRQSYYNALHQLGK